MYFINYFKAFFQRSNLSKIKDSNSKKEAGKFFNIFVPQIKSQKVCVIDPNKILNLKLFDEYGIDVSFRLNQVDALGIIDYNTVYDAFVINFSAKELNIDSLLNSIFLSKSYINAKILAIAHKNQRQILLDKGVNAVINYFDNHDITQEVLIKVLKILKIQVPISKFSDNCVRLPNPSNSNSIAINILLADDNAVCLKILSKYIRSYGFNVIECLNMDSAFSNIENTYYNKIDLIVIGIYMSYEVNLNNFSMIYI